MQHPQKVNPQKKSSLWAWLAALGTLALAVALLLLMPLIQRRFPAKPQAVVSDYPVRTLELTETSRVESITVHPQGADSYTLVMENGALYAQSAEGLLELNADYAQEILKAVTEITVQNVVSENPQEVSAHLADMGLEPPRSYARVRYTDGTEATIEVGDIVPGTAYSYYRWSGSQGVYMCDEGIRDALNMSLKRLLPVQQFEIRGSLVRQLSIDEMTVRFETGASGESRGYLTEPYGYPISSKQTQSLLEALESFRLGAQEPDITDENRGDYGFDDPLCQVEIRTEKGYASVVDASGQMTAYEAPAQTIRFTIGRAEGDYFYTCQYEGGYYLISRFLAETLVTASPAGLASRNPADMGDSFVTRIALHAPSGEVQVEARRTERVLANNQVKTDENGNPEYDTLITFNGETASQERLDSLLDALRQLTVTGDAPANWTAPAQEQPRWTVYLETEDGNKRLIEAYRLDAFTDVLCVDGVSLHVTDDEAVDRILGSVLAPKYQEEKEDANPES